MRLFIYLLPLLLIAQSDKVVEEIVKGKAELKIEGTKRPKMTLRVNPEEPIDSVMRMRKVIRETEDVPILDSILFLALYEPSPFLKSPVGFAPRETVKIAIPQNLGKVKSWELSLIDSRGQVLTKVEGEGKPEDTIAWNGISREGKILIVGEPMTPVLLLEDDNGTRRVVMDPISMNSFKVDLGDSILVSYKLDLLFDPRSEELMESGKVYVDAVLNIARDVNSYKMRVRIYSRDFRANTSWRQVLSRYIKMRIPLEELTVVSIPLREAGKRYERVEFSILKER